VDEVITFVEQGSAEVFGDGVGKAVTEVRRAG
jgi:hypothetical protein